MARSSIGLCGWLVVVASVLFLTVTPGVASAATKPLPCALSRSPFVMEHALPPALQCQFDQDGNGLDDEVERELAQCFVPKFKFDHAEEATRSEEPHVLFTTRRLPTSDGPSGATQLQIKMVALWASDGGFYGGYGPACGADTHSGDGNYFGVNVAISRGAESWVAHMTSFDGCSADDGFYCSGGYPGGAVDAGGKYQRYFDGTHAVVYPSAGKHHIYVFPGMSSYEVDTGPLPFGITCDDAHRGDGASVTPGKHESAQLRHVPAGVYDSCKLISVQSSPPGLYDVCLCHPSWQNACFASRGLSVPIDGSFQSDDLSNLGYYGEVISNISFLGGSAGIWGQLAFPRTPDPDIDGDGIPDLYAPGRYEQGCSDLAAHPPVAPTDRCPIDPNDAADPNLDGDDLYGLCDPDHRYRNQYVAGGSAEWLAYSGAPQRFIPLVSMRYPRGGLWDSDGDGYVEGEDLCPTLHGGGSVNAPEHNLNAWGEELNFAEADGSRDPGFFYRGDLCDPYPATATRWEETGVPRQTHVCDVFPRAEVGGKDEYRLRVSVRAGRSANDPNRDAPDNRQFLVQPFRCTCPEGEAEHCMSDFDSPCFADRMSEAGNEDLPGTSWRPVQRPDCLEDQDGYCRPLTLPNPGGATVRWAWLDEQLTRPEHFPPGTFTTSPEYEALPPFAPTGRTRYAAGPHALWTLTLEGESFNAAPGLAFPTPQGARFPEPERTDYGAMLEDIFSPESRRLRSSFAPPVSLRSAYVEWLPPGSWCEPEPLFDPCVVAGCDLAQWWTWTVRPPELEQVGGGLFRNPLLADVWFWQRRGARLVDTVLAQAATGALSLGLDDVGHWTAEAAGHATLLGAGEAPLTALFVEHVGQRPRWALLEASSQDTSQVMFTLRAEGELPAAITSEVRLLSDPLGADAVLLDPELDQLLRFDAASREWRPQPLTVPVSSLMADAAALVGGVLHVAPTAGSAGWLVHLSSGAATEWAPQLPARAGARLTPSLDRQGLLLTGGASAAGPHDDVWFVPFEPGALSARQLVADSPAPAAGHAARALVGYADGSRLISAGSGPGGQGLTLSPSVEGQWAAPSCLAPDLKALAAFATSELWVGAGAKLLSAGGRASAGSGGDARVGIGAGVATVVSGGHVSIGLGAQLTGDAIAHGSVVNHGAVAGQVQPGARVELSGLGCLQLSFPAATSAVNVLPLTTKLLAPGSYTHVKLLPRGTLKLSAGTYFFKRLDALPLARIELDTTAGPVRVFVEQQLSMLGDWVASPSAAERIVLGYWGAAPLTWVRPFAGTLLAPSAAVTLGNWEPGALHGAFFARELSVLPGVELRHRPFLGELLP